jgi:hypothetical protein
VRCLGAWFSGGHRDESGQAAMVARQILVDALAGVAMTFIYDYKDDGADPAVSEMNFGVTRPDNSPKPAFAAAAAARAVLSKSSTVDRLPVSAAGDVFALQFADQAGTTTAIAVWNATGGCGARNGSAPLRIRGTPARCFSISSILGEAAGEVCRARPGGEVVVDGVSDAVLYLHPTALKTDEVAGVLYKGVDLSYVPQAEALGFQYYKKRGGPAGDAVKIVAGNGANIARLRIWHDPPYPNQTYANVSNVLKMAKRVYEAGMQVHLDFMYSDWWADPGQQWMPRAWSGCPDCACIEGKNCRCAAGDGCRTGVTSHGP